jgi:hypothetical protein
LKVTVGVVAGGAADRPPQAAAVATARTVTMRCGGDNLTGVVYLHDIPVNGA